MSYTYRDFLNDFPEIRKDDFFELRRDGLYLAESPIEKLPKHLQTSIAEREKNVFEDHPDGMPGNPILKFGEECTRENVIRRFICYYGVYDFCCNEILLNEAMAKIDGADQEEVDASMDGGPIAESPKAGVAITPTVVWETLKARAGKENPVLKDYDGETIGFFENSQQMKRLTMPALKARMRRRKTNKQQRYGALALEIEKVIAELEGH